MLTFLREEGHKIIMAVYASPCDIDDHITFSVNGEWMEIKKPEKKKKWSFHDHSKYDGKSIGEGWTTMEQFKRSLALMVKDIKKKEESEEEEEEE